ncbi:MAG: hypothetical protein JNM95_11205 [Chitinophagaceae bacterium]|nr:hypothetical protein [Chitinophagaceae bacterium]
MRKKGQRNADTILYILPKGSVDLSAKTEEHITITKEMAIEFEKLGALLRGILCRHKENGYSIIGGRVFDQNKELIYEKNYNLCKE